MRAAWLGVVLSLALVSCDTALDQRLAIVDSTRVLAVVAEPAEARPGSAVAYTALVASPSGPVATPPAWAFCLAPLPPTEDDVVVPACTGTAQVAQLGSGESVMGTLPGSGCLLYGPDTPPGGFRPRSADDTGGYYQPVRAEVAGEIAFGLSRIYCDLPNAPPGPSLEYLEMYQMNANPTLLPLALADATGAPLAATALAADSDVTLTAAWPGSAAESYIAYDPASEAIVARRESMRVSWFATGGTLPVDASAVAEDDMTTSVSTTWHTPAATGAAWLWLVLRDSRGGIATQQIAITLH
jgi:hypothetical protein